MFFFAIKRKFSLKISGTESWNRCGQLVDVSSEEKSGEGPITLWQFIALIKHILFKCLY